VSLSASGTVNITWSSATTLSNVFTGAGTLGMYATAGLALGATPGIDANFSGFSGTINVDTSRAGYYPNLRTGVGILDLSSATLNLMGQSGQTGINQGGFYTFSSQTVNIGALTGDGVLLSAYIVNTNYNIGYLNTSTNFSGIIANDPYGGTAFVNKVGSGTLTLSGTNTYSGATTVSAGTLKAGSTSAFGSNSATTVASGATLDLAGFSNAVGSLAGAGTVTNSGAAATLTAGGNNTSTTFSGVIQNGSGTTGLTKSGTGNFTLTGNNTHTGLTTVSAGTLTLSPTTSNSIGAITVAGGAAGATLVVSGATTASGAVVVGANTTDTNAVAQISANLTATGIFLGNANGAIGTVTQTAGVVTANGGGDPNFGIGQAVGGTGTYNLSGGTVNSTVGNFNVGSFGNGTFNQTGGTVNSAGWTIIGRRVGVTGTYNLTGGTLNQTFGGAKLYVGEEGTGVLNISGTGVVNATGGVGISGGAGPTGVGTINLNSGGTINTPLVQKNSGSSATFNFNGGLLQATIANSTFMTGLTSTVVQSGGGLINDGGFAVTIGQSMSGTGGLTKSGAGTLSLSGSNTYSGATTVSTGTLKAGSAAAFGTNSATTVASGATLDLAGSCHLDRFFGGRWHSDQFWSCCDADDRRRQHVDDVYRQPPERNRCNGTDQNGNRGTDTQRNGDQLYRGDYAECGHAGLARYNQLCIGIHSQREWYTFARPHGQRFCFTRGDHDHDHWRRDCVD